MQINKINNNSQNFGVQCSQLLRTRIANCTPATEIFPIFRNSEKLAQEIGNIGSKNTTLTDFRIKRIVRDNFFDGDTEVVDKCFLKFKMLTEKGKKETVTAQISSSDGVIASESQDIFKDFVNIVKMSEEAFLAGHLEKLAKKGNMDRASVMTLVDMYPEHKFLIRETASAFSDMNQMLVETKRAGLIGRIKSLFTGK